MGAGTTTISLVKYQQGLLSIVATHGEMFLGGESLTQQMVNDYYKQIEESHGKINREKEPELHNNIRFQCEAAKLKICSGNRSVTTTVNFRGESIVKEWTYDTFIASNVHSFTRLGMFLQQFKKKIDLSKEHIDVVLIMGKSSNIIQVRKILRTILGIESGKYDNVIEHNLVAKGAAILADPNEAVKNVMTMEIGIKLWKNFRVSTHQSIYRITCTIDILHDKS